MSRAEGFSRPPGGPFDDLPREDFAQALSRGLGPVKAGEHVGIAKATALAWNKHESMTERVRELRASSSTFVVLSKQAIFQEIVQVAKESRAAEHYKTALQAYELLYKIRCTDKDFEGKDPSALPGPRTDAELLELHSQMMAAPRTRAMSVTECIDTEGEEQ